MQTKEVYINSGNNKLFGKFTIIDVQKPTIILLHGLGFHSFEYDELVPKLAEGGYNCLAFDFRSCGKSEGKRGCWILDDYVEDTKEAVNFVKNNANGSIILYGNSLGADAGISFLAKYPNEGIKVIIAANCATRTADFVLTPFRRFLFFMATLFQFIPFKINVNHFIPYKLIIDTPEKVKEVANDKLVSDARSFSYATYKDIFSWDMTKIVPSVKIPILIIQGKNDRLQPLSQANKLYDAANQPKEILMIESGHLPNIDKPKYLSEIVLKWLSKVV